MYFPFLSSFLSFCIFPNCIRDVVWRLRGNIIRTVLYIANVLPLQWAQLTKTVHTAQLGLELNEPPSSILLPPRCCGLGAGSIPLRAIVNKKQCEMSGLFTYVAGHTLLNRRCTIRLPGCFYFPKRKL